jgi:hypothetical protein
MLQVRGLYLSIAKDVVKVAARELDKRTCKCAHCSYDCNNNCKECLEDIHMKGDLRLYDCHFMRSYYLVSYLYKYKKEIRMGLLYRTKEIQRHLRFKGYLKVVSFGCGPGTEIVGFAEYLTELSKLDNLNGLTIKYVGIDVNEGWEHYFYEVTRSVQSSLAKKGIEFKPHFYYADVLNFDLNDERIDIVIMPYVLSEMKKHANTDEIMTRRVRYLWNKIENKMGDKSLVFCNDINHNTKARDYFDLLAQQISCLSFRRDSCFEQKKKFYHFGDVLKDTTIDDDLPADIRGKYNVWENCTSAQSLFFLDKR